MARYLSQRADICHSSIPQFFRNGPSSSHLSSLIRFRPLHGSTFRRSLRPWTVSSAYLTVHLSHLPRQDCRRRMRRKMEELKVQWKGTGQTRQRPLLKETSLKSQKSDSVIFSCQISSYQLNVPVILRELFQILQNYYEEIIAKMEKFVKSAFPLIFLEIHMHRVLQLYAFLP